MLARRTALHLVRSGALVLGLAGLSLLAYAQDDAPAAPLEPTQDEPRGANMKIERIQHEDAGTRIDELRVRGETRSITVQPKNGAPSYDVTPPRGGEEPSPGSGSTTGRSRWRLLNF
jgi:hypothetical protein